MAQRRMFAIKIIDSAKFLKMPSSSRLLYYDLGMRADDDGIVEAFNVLRMTGATEDDLRILVAKDYIKVLNDDLVTYINDWRENNQLRADRKVDSMYKNLLLQVIPEVDLLESKTRSDRNNKNNFKVGTSQGQPNDNQGTEEYRLEQYSKDKDRIGKDSLSSSSNSSEEEELLEVMRICQKIFLKLKKVDAKDFIGIYGIQKVKQALITISHSKTNISNPTAYLAATLQNLGRDKTVNININKSKNSNFLNHSTRDYDYDALEDELLGFDNEVK